MAKSCPPREVLSLTHGDDGPTGAAASEGTVGWNGGGEEKEGLEVYAHTARRSKGIDREQPSRRAASEDGMAVVARS